MKKLFVILAAFAALAVVASCEKEPKIDLTGGVSVGADNLVAYFPLDSKDAVVTKGEGVSFAELGGKGEFAAKGARGGCYNNSSADHDTQAYLKLNVPKDFLKSLGSFTVGAWVNTPTNRGGIVTFDGGTDANWGAWDLFFDGGDDAGTVLKGYLFNNGTEWGGFYPSYKGAEVAQNKWIYLTYTYDEATSYANLFVNGVLVGPADEEGKIAGTNLCWAGPADGEGNQAKVGKLNLSEVSCLYIGAFASRETGKSQEGWLSYFAGKIDEVRVYNKGFNEAVVKALFQAEVKAADNID
ncbi:MAG: LamG domain-containing protein [Bacteroidales bacterium]|nr:LamG domain-containing protein [Bacteroidales bacterium]